MKQKLIKSINLFAFIKYEKLRKNESDFLNINFNQLLKII